MESPLLHTTVEGKVERAQPPKSDLPLHSGLRLFHGRYELGKQLGVGGMGVVWLAKDHELEGQLVALKFLPGVRAWSEIDLSRLRKEVRASLQLRDPRVVATYGLAHEPPFAAMVMEYVDGVTLKQALEQSPEGYFEPETVVPWMRELVAALKYLHGTAHRVHRDIKPANVMLAKPEQPGQPEQVKLMDFGISEDTRHTLSQHTVQHPGMGSSHTLACASPSQLDGHPAEEQDDIYSLGALLYELLTGRPPFFRGNADVVASQIRQVPPALLEKRRDELLHDGVISGTLRPIPIAWEQLVADCLAKQPDARPTLDELGEFFSKPVRPLVTKSLAAARPADVLQAIKKQDSIHEPKLPTPDQDAALPAPQPKVELMPAEETFADEEVAAELPEERVPVYLPPETDRGFRFSFMKIAAGIMALALGYLVWVWFEPDEPVLQNVHSRAEAEEVVRAYYAAAEKPNMQDLRAKLLAAKVRYFDEGILSKFEVGVAETNHHESLLSETYKVDSAVCNDPPGQHFHFKVKITVRLEDRDKITTAHHEGHVKMDDEQGRLVISAIDAERVGNPQVIYKAQGIEGDSRLHEPTTAKPIPKAVEVPSQAVSVPE
jgi:serine/threonine protein kinase